MAAIPLLLDRKPGWYVLGWLDGQMPTHQKVEGPYSEQAEAYAAIDEAKTKIQGFRHGQPYYVAPPRTEADNAA